ncbi:LysR substrate-binding domain-containing protein [Cupriavidus sp. PET2-C1]
MSKASLDLQLLRVLHTLLTECSVSRTAILLGQSQPSVSVALRRLREMTGDPLLVRSGSRMVPTTQALALIEPASQALAGMSSILNPALPFDPATTTRTFRIACPDYLDVFFIPAIVERFQAQAPHAVLEFRHLADEGGYERGLESGFLDLVVGNWQRPPEQLHLQPLCRDELVCLMRARHPIPPGKLTKEAFAAASHLAVTTHHTTGQGTIDTELSRSALSRSVTTTLPYFCMAPYVLMRSDLLFTTTRAFAMHYARLLDLRVEPVPIPARVLKYYQLWHARTHRGAAPQWLRGVVAEVARSVIAQR